MSINENKDLEERIKNKIVCLRIDSKHFIKYLGIFKEFIYLGSRTRVVLTDSICYIEDTANFLGIDKTTGKYKIRYPKGQISELELVDLNKIMGISVYDKVKEENE